MRYPPPPPYVPPEYHRCKYSEIPEPYRSQIDLWIEAKTRYYEQQAKHARMMSSIVLVSVTAFILLAFALAFVKG